MLKEKKNTKDHLVSFFTKLFQINSVNRSTLEEKTILSFKLYQLFMVVFSSLILFFIFTLLLIIYTPVNNWLPKVELSKKREVFELLTRVDSLEENLRVQSQYVNVVNKILNGEVVDSLFPTAIDSLITTENTGPIHSSADSSLRAMVISEDKYNIPTYYDKSTKTLEDFVFFKPIEGVITRGFNIFEGHYGVDIGAHTGASVKSCLDGVVIFSDWSISNGNMIIIQHKNNIVSVYMHNSILTKKTNELVKTGEVIAIVGNSGELSSGPHLHFELWQNGNPINPLEYIDF